ncbi:MAG: hypothetical protein Q9187_009031, partial [Circinaria calcarea]
SPYAQVLSTIPSFNSPRFPFPGSTPSAFAASYVDRSRAPETECWLFSTIELCPDPPYSSDSLSPTLSSESYKAVADTATAKSQLLALLNHIAQLPLPPSFPSHLDPSLLLVGSLHSYNLIILKGGPVALNSGQRVISGPSANDHVHGDIKKGGKNDSGCIRGHTIPYKKFLIAPRSRERGDARTWPLPDGLCWSRVKEDELPLVLSRTEIPRTERTLKLLPSVAIRARRKLSCTTTTEDEKQCNGDNGRLIAWAFLGVDGSLTSLHVEAEWRGSGLGKKVAGRLFGLLRAQDGREGQEESEGGFEDLRRGEEWGHSDVAADNAGSIGVARGLGGREGWECFWGFVDLGKLDEIKG